MNLNLQSDIYGPVQFVDGFPPNFFDKLLPQAISYHAIGPWGVICMQEINTSQYLLRHFLFHLQNTLAFNETEKDEGLQSLLSLEGHIRYRVNGLKEVLIKEREYTLVNPCNEKATITVMGNRLCSLLNTYYYPEAYAGLKPLFPSFVSDLQKAIRKPFIFLFPPKVSRTSVHNAIEAIWFDRYIDSLQKKHIEIRLGSTLFTLLAQTYTPGDVELGNPTQRKKAAAAREIILRNIKVHLTPGQIASELNCTSSWLKKAFSTVYGIGMYHFLRKTRMEIARNMLLKGESLKAVAIEVGMKPRNFPKEFKTFFGYTVTALKKGQI